jgi:hypothetical protein
MAGVKEEDGVTFALAHTTQGSSLIHRSAWKGDSTKLAKKSPEDRKTCCLPPTPSPTWMICYNSYIGYIAGSCLHISLLRPTIERGVW